MTYSTLMVHLDLSTPNDAVLQVTADLAERLQTHVIGIAACQPMQASFADGYISGDMVTMDRVEINRELVEAEAAFRTVLHRRNCTIEWRSRTSLVLLADYVAEQCRATDMLITGPDQGWSAFDSSRRVVISSLVMQSGRPVLIVPQRVSELSLDHVVVAWKDTREARRAVTDALPLLKMAGHVTVVEIAAKEEMTSARERVADVVAWLARRSVRSEGLATSSREIDSEVLEDVLDERKADLLVAGAYGHNRLREWALGGVTKDLLMNPNRCCLVTH